MKKGKAITAILGGDFTNWFITTANVPLSVNLQVLTDKYIFCIASILLINVGS